MIRDLNRADGLHSPMGHGSRVGLEVLRYSRCAKHVSYASGLQSTQVSISIVQHA